jgi:DNA sulfur modification protein DndB
MSLSEVAERIIFAKDMYKEEPQWSEMLQRDLKESRASDISEYLKNNDRFFNSIVVGIYAGEPLWYNIDIEKSQSDVDIEDIPESSRESMGFLSLSGDEQLYAIDGQHRLLGIKAAIEDGKQIQSDELSIVFVSISDTPSGRIRSRRLFTTINKKAKSVGLGARIALDEDDIVAILTRRLVEMSDFFDEDTILLSSTAALPPSKFSYLTTAGNLYKIVFLLLKEYCKREQGIKTGFKKILTDSSRPEDDILAMYYEHVHDFFEQLINTFAPLREYLDSNDKLKVGMKYRGDASQHLLFRPVGLSLIAELYSLMEGSPEQRMEILHQHMPTELTDEPYLGIIWSRHVNRLLKGSDRENHLRFYFKYIFGMKLTDKNIETLRKALGDIQECEPQDVVLPERIAL